MERSSRVAWIDAIRGAGILAIIAFHSGFLPFIKISDPLLSSWMLPVFVLTGGWLLKDTSLTASRTLFTIRRMLIPFFVCGVVSFLGWVILRQVYPQHILDQPVGQEVMKWLTGRNAYFNSPLWFLPAYCIASLVMRSVAVWWFRRPVIVRSILSILFVAVGFFLSHPYQYPIFSYDLIVLFIGMMMLGSVASTIRLPKSIFRTRWDICMLTAFVILVFSNGYVDMFQREFNNSILYILGALAGTYAIARFLYTNPTKSLVSLGRSSMSLMIWHWPVMQWLTYGLFATGLLHPLAVHFTKTSFTLSTGGLRTVILQIIFCCLYTGMSVFFIFAGNRLQRRLAV